MSPERRTFSLSTSLIILTTYPITKIHPHEIITADNIFLITGIIFPRRERERERLDTSPKVRTKRLCSDDLKEIAAKQHFHNIKLPGHKILSFTDGNS